MQKSESVDAAYIQFKYEIEAKNVEILQRKTENRMSLP